MLLALSFLTTDAPFVYDLPHVEHFLSALPVAISIQLAAVLLFAFLLFLVGLFGILLNCKNFLVTMMAVELMYLGVVSSFVLLGVICHDARGAIYALLFLILAACESAVGLGLLIVLYRFGRSISFSSYEHLGG